MATPRPNKLTPEIAELAAREVVGDLIKNGHLEESDLEGAVKDLVKCGRTHIDGYELAKELEDRCHWECDLEMANELDSFAHAASEEIRKAEKAWAAREAIVPPLPLGAHVKIKSWRETETGLIDGIYEYGAAQYLIKIDADPEADRPSRSRRIVNFEDVEAEASTAPATAEAS